jgi:hypothetical protein
MNERSKEKSPPQIEVRFSPGFTRAERRRERRLHFFGALLTGLVGSVLLIDSVRAYRAHTWVDVGARLTDHVLLPPALGVLAGLVCLLICILSINALRRLSS